MTPEPIAPAPPPMPAGAAEAERIIHGDKTHPYHVKNHPQHDAAVAHVQRLYAVTTDPNAPRLGRSPRDRRRSRRVCRRIRAIPITTRATPGTTRPCAR